MRALLARCGAGHALTHTNDLGLSCASNMVATRSEVQAEVCGPPSLPRQLQTFVRELAVRSPLIGNTFVTPDG